MLNTAVMGCILRRRWVASHYVNSTLTPFPENNHRVRLNVFVVDEDVICFQLTPGL